MTHFVPLSADVDGTVSAVNVGDWLLQILKIKKSEKETKAYYAEFSAQLMEDPNSHEPSIDNVRLFNLLLSEVNTVLSLLDDAEQNGGVSVPVTVVDSTNTTTEKLVYKTHAEVVKEVEEFFIVLMSMIATRFQQADSSVTGTAVSDLCKVLKCSHSHSKMRLRLLESLYNVFPPNFPYRFPIFSATLEYAAETEQFHTILPYMRYLNEWIRDWTLNVASKRKLYLILANQLKKLGKSEEAYPYLKRHIQFYQGEKSALLSDEAIVSAAVELAEDSIKLSDIMYFDSILELDAVANLRNTNYKYLVVLLEIFLKNGPKELQAFYSNHPDVFDKHSLDYNQCLNKIRLLAISSLAAESSKLSIQEISNFLDLSEYETQEIAVQAIGQGLLDAKIDQMNNVVHVRSAMQREFKRPEWELLLKKLKNWTENVDYIASISTKQ